MKTKYILALALSLALVFTLTACGGRNTASDTQPDAKLSVVATTFPLYDWIRQVLGDRAGDADLDRRYAAAVAAGTKGTLVFGDRFPFLYLAGDYGLDYYAAFVGCSAESEASFETVIFLANKVDELGLGCVMKLEGGDGKLAQTVVENTADKTAAVLELDSMQSTTSLDDDYLSVMENNLRMLKDALK